MPGSVSEPEHVHTTARVWAMRDAGDDVGCDRGGVDESGPERADQIRIRLWLMRPDRATTPP
ncbi:hypothetical protein GCM10010244_47790 [Streptomyces coeruleorubidus]|nr:hypothetical protein GCM10010244_47790 [Streptomyces bellus]